VVGYVTAVDEVSFDMRRGETLGLLGKSGWGKTTTGRLLLRLVDPTAGEVRFEGKNIYSLNRGHMQTARSELQGDVPSPSKPPRGCHFHARCPYVMPECREVKPRLTDLGRDHWVACHLRSPGVGG